jgi:hypothetical protein
MRLFREFLCVAGLSFVLILQHLFHIASLRHQPRFETLPGILGQLGNNLGGGLE